MAVVSEHKDFSTPTNSPGKWKNIPHAFCGGKRQSPINIVTRDATANSALNTFILDNVSAPHVLKSLNKNGHNVNFILNDGMVDVRGGGLNGTYSSSYFHLHWGDTEHHPGSEHTINGYRYPMEMHLVSLKKGLTLEEATAHPEGLAVLGFFINITEDAVVSQPWKDITSYLMDLTGEDAIIPINHTLSIHDLLGQVDLTKFFRYMGSLSTPNCNEEVVWTVFHEPIKISRQLIGQFPKKTRTTNVYRPLQPLNGRRVFSSPAITAGTCEEIMVWTIFKQPIKVDKKLTSPSRLQWVQNATARLLRGTRKRDPISPTLASLRCHEHHETSSLNVSFYYGLGMRKMALQLFCWFFLSVVVQLSSGVQVSGGGLSEAYDALQFHLHWGNGSAVPGSEHTVDGKRYPMELHIVNVKSSYKLNTTLAVADSTGLAALGFLIEVMPGNDTGLPASWKTLTSYLTNISNKGDIANVSVGISLDDLLAGVDRTKYYRYMGSLTTPSCNEAVVWTVFKDPIKVSKDLIDLFSSTVYFNTTTSSVLMTNTYRGIQSALPVTTQVRSTAAGSKTGYSLGLICLAMLLFRA
ncbi:carbonic anhydrase XVb [Aplochiton taeniatus]